MLEGSLGSRQAIREEFFKCPPLPPTESPKDAATLDGNQRDAMKSNSGESASSKAKEGDFGRGYLKPPIVLYVLGLAAVFLLAITVIVGLIVIAKKAKRT